MDLGHSLSYYLTTGYEKIKYSSGLGWQDAATASNIDLLNRAIKDGYYNFFFDRSIEMGTETVVISKKQVVNLENVFKKLLASGEKLGYKLVDQNKYSYVFHKDTPSVFGVSTKYAGITIGKDAGELTLEFPSFKIGDSLILDNYTFDELKDYKTIYLSGFEYNDKDKAEELIRKLTDNGVKVYIDMNRVPSDSLTNRMNFLGVTAQSIILKNNYPDLIYKDNVIESSAFKTEDSTWSTIYLENLTNVYGYSNFKDEKLDFLGTGENENIVFIGFNIVFHAMETGDSNELKLLRDIFEVDENTLPQRNVIPIDVRYEKNKIIIKSPQDNVNTTVAYQDNFISCENIVNENNLLVVDKGTTEIEIRYPYFTKGLIITLIGIIGMIILSYFIFKKNSPVKKTRG